MQSQAEFDASIRVLKALRHQQLATIVTTWDESMQRAFVGLSRMGYVDTGAPPSSFSGRTLKSSAPYRWNYIRISDLGRTYLDSIEAAQRAAGK